MLAWLEGFAEWSQDPFVHVLAMVHEGHLDILKLKQCCRDRVWVVMNR